MTGAKQYIATSLLALALTACGGGDGLPVAEYPIVPTAAMIDTGSALYAEHCAVCHADPETGGVRQFDAPRHDVDGHTWHHADRQLVAWVLDGVPIATVMPAFGGRLSEEEVTAVIGYIKSTWPSEVQERQALMSQAWEDQLRE